MTTRPAERLFRGERLRVQRLLRGLSQSELSRASGVAASMVSRLERGDRQPSSDVVAALADVLEVDTSLFFERLFFEARAEEVHFRHRARTAASARYSALGHVTLLAELVDFFDANLELPPVRLPTLPEARGLRWIEDAAVATRQALDLPEDRPLTSVVEAIESAGVPVVLAPGGSNDVDAFSVGREPRSLVILNQRDSGSRMNFTGAHELGHLVLHQGLETGGRETESEADRFASSFLLPARAFSREFPRQRGRSLDWEALIGLKLRWRVSIQAMVRRAFDLKMIRASTYRLACQYASAQGWRRADPGEPGEFEPDRPLLLRECFAACESLLGVQAVDIATRLHWTPSLLVRISCLPDLDLGSTGGTVIPFNRRGRT